MAEENDKDFLVIRLIRMKTPYFLTLSDDVPVWKAIYAIYATVLSESAVFTWTYIDILIMTISVALTTHFKLFNAELERAKHEVTFICFVIREKRIDWFSCLQ